MPLRMTMPALRKSFALFWTLSSAGALVGCEAYTPGLDQEIADLRSDIETSRAVLDKQATAYLVPTGVDYRAELGTTTLGEILKPFNEKPSNEKIISLDSYDSNNGHVEEHFDRCPKPRRNLDFGFFLATDKDPHAFNVSIYLNSIDYSVNENGFDFHLYNLGAKGGISLVLWARGCRYSPREAPTGPPFFVPIGLVTPDAKGHVLVRLAANGIKFVATIDTLAIFPPIKAGPFDYSPKINLEQDIAEGTIPNLVGEDGKVQVTPLSKIRKFRIGIDLRDFKFLQDGVQVSGPMLIEWKDPPAP